MSLLPSWRLTPTRQAILDFVADVTTPGHPDFIDPLDRVAVFDDDGTLWPDRPMALQVYFLVDQIQTMATKAGQPAYGQPVHALLEQDYSLLKTVSQPDLLMLLCEIHAGLTPEEVAELAQIWWRSALHPHLGQPVRSCLFQPMQELLTYLHSHGFVCFVMASGNLDFARVAAGCGYNLPPERVIGCGPRTRLEYRQGRADLVNLADYNTLVHREGKVSALYRHVGRRPVLAAGNSSSDLAMLHYTASGTGRRLTLLLHHGDSDPLAVVPSPSVAPADLPRGGLVVDLQRDFGQMFPAAIALARAR